MSRTFSDERGTGTFHTLGALPKRKLSPVFHLAHDDDDEHTDEHDPTTVPFPRSTSPPSPHHLPRDTSAPVLLSNGKPLKSSLKTSTSSPAILTPPQAQHTHLRARSEPSTPAVTPKNVHFPEKGYALATVRVFNRSARPAALSTPDANGDETETEGEETPPTRFPFPPTPHRFNYEIDPTKSSPIPSHFSLAENLLLESLNLSPCSPSPAKPSLTGSILVRNLAFEKHVAIRFTLDDWQTVSEVGAHYVDSLPLLPSQILLSLPVAAPEDPSPQRGRGWDRFTFSIRLEDYSHSLTSRTLWLAARYHIDSTYPEPGSTTYGPGGEWWDNNHNRNYRIQFRPAVATLTSQGRPRRETVSAQVPSPRTHPQPVMTCKEHVFGHMLPSVPNNNEVQVHEADRRSIPRAGKLSLCNYVPPTVRVASLISFSPAGSPQRSSPSSTTPLGMRSPSDDDTASPASSTLSTPCVSPTMAPRVIINGQLATSHSHNPSEKEDAITSRPGHVADWDWPALNKPQIDGPARQYADLVPISEPLERRRDIPPSIGRKAISGRNCNSLYEAFVTQWCFAEGPSPALNGYDNGGIMA